MQRFLALRWALLALVLLSVAVAATEDVKTKATVQVDDEEEVGEDTFEDYAEAVGADLEDDEEDDDDDDDDDEGETPVETKKSSPVKEEPKKEAPKKVEPKKEEPKKEAPKKEEPKKEEPKKEEPVKEEPKSRAIKTDSGSESSSTGVLGKVKSTTGGAIGACVDKTKSFFKRCKNMSKKDMTKTAVAAVGLWGVSVAVGWLAESINAPLEPPQGRGRKK